MSKPTGKLLFAYNTITALNERIAELEKERAIGVYHFTVEEYKIHNLEQQEKAVNILYKNGKCDADSWEFIKAKGGAD